MYIFNNEEGDDKMAMMSAVMRMTADDYAADGSEIVLDGEELS